MEFIKVYPVRLDGGNYVIRNVYPNGVNINTAHVESVTVYDNRAEVEFTTGKSWTVDRAELLNNYPQFK